MENDEQERLVQPVQVCGLVCSLVVCVKPCHQKKNIFLDRNVEISS